MKPLITVLLLLVAGVLGCGDVAESPCGGGQLEGVQGRVEASGTGQPVFFADVTLLTQLQFEVATTAADDDGRFSFPTNAIPEDGTYVLIAESGPIRGPVQPQPFDVLGGCSPFQTVRLETN